MPYTVNTASRSANSRKITQVTVLIGSGSKRRSVTRHISLVGRSWIGLNPDPRAIPLNEQYEQEFAEAKSELVSAETRVGIIEKKLEEISKAPEGDIVTESMLLAAHVTLEEQLELAQDNVYAATADVADAKAKLNIVRRELPLEVEFDGPGLTY